jgi:uncharacterized protein (TIGR00730 family)
LNQNPAPDPGPAREAAPFGGPLEPRRADEARLIEGLLAAPGYRRADADLEFLNRPELRPVRMQLELLKAELALVEHQVRSTIVLFGGARIVDRAAAEARLTRAELAVKERPDDPLAARELQVARALLEKARYYDEARAFARLVSGQCQISGACDYVIVTGGGPGIMEAGNRGAHDVGAMSIGLNITLPHEQLPNPYISPELCFQFRYFALRKMHFMLRAAAVILFPGGFGTIDEMFEALTLRQTGKLQPVPIVLYGSDYWRNTINFRFLADEGAISDADLALIHYADTPAEAWEVIRKFHKLRNAGPS